MWDIWVRLRAVIEADAARPDGRTVAYLEGALANLGWMLESDPQLSIPQAMGNRTQTEAAVLNRNPASACPARRSR